jgi:hypothetical protein
MTLLAACRSIDMGSGSLWHGIVAARRGDCTRLDAKHYTGLPFRTIKKKEGLPFRAGVDCKTMN